MSNRTMKFKFFTLSHAAKEEHNPTIDRMLICVFDQTKQISNQNIDLVNFQKEIFIIKNDSEISITPPLLVQMWRVSKKS